MTQEDMTELRERMAKLEGIMEQMAVRVGNLESRMEAGFSELSRRIDDLGREFRANFRWTMGIIITMWVTIILAIILRGG